MEDFFGPNECGSSKRSALSVFRIARKLLFIFNHKEDKEVRLLLCPAALLRTYFNVLSDFNELPTGRVGSRATFWLQKRDLHLLILLGEIHREG